MNYKTSRYNLVLNIDDDKLIYNGLTGGFAKINQEIVDILKNDQIDDTTENISKYVDNLKKGGFILESGFNEIDYIDVTHKLHRYQNSALLLTILPTLRCNFKCSYCFETESPSDMNEQTCSDVQEFVLNKTSWNKSLNVTWFGGEPLLKNDIITKLSSTFIDAAAKRNASYSASMVSNGFLLKPQMSKWVEENKIESIQFTLDGPPEIHNKRRVLKNGGGTFKTILDNLVFFADKVKMQIRVNVDKSNSDSMDELLDIFVEKGLAGKIVIGFGAVAEVEKICPDKGSNCYSDIDFSDTLLQLSIKALKRGFAASYPQRRVCVCAAPMSNSYVIDPSGYLHKCWATSGVTQEYISHVSEGIIPNTNYMKWLTWDPLQDTECRDCSVLPICMGFCPHRWVGGDGTISKRCSEWKYSLMQTLALHYTSYKGKGKGGDNE